MRNTKIKMVQHTVFFRRNEIFRTILIWKISFSQRGLSHRYANYLLCGTPTPGRRLLPNLEWAGACHEPREITIWKCSNKILKNKQTKITRKIDLPVSNDRSRIPRAKSASLCPSDIPLAAFQRLYSGEIRAEFKISPFFSSFKGNKRRAPQVLECIWTWRTTRGTPNWSDSGRFLWK